MLSFFKAVFEWFGETRRLKAKNALMEQQLVAAVQSPDCSPELAEAATMYFSRKPSDPALPAVKKENSNGSH